MGSWPQTVALGLALLAIGHICVTIIGSWRGMLARRRKEQLTIQSMIGELDRARDQRAAAEAAKPPEAWKGWRPMTVARKQDEGGDICSFYLEDPTQPRLPSFTPGQFLAVRVPAGADAKNMTRCYSLSEAQRDGHYRISVKRDRGYKGSPPGVVSNFMHDEVTEGTTVDVQAPKGAFVLDPRAPAPPRIAVLIAGGVGITPLLSMLEGLLDEETSTRPVILFYGVANGDGHAMKRHLEALAADHANRFSLKVCYSRPRDVDQFGADYHHEGRVTTDLVLEVLDGDEADFYLCGPGPMMEMMVPQLRERGIPEPQIHYEAFGPASVPAPKKAKPTEPAAETKGVEPSGNGSGSITFSQEDQRISWDGTKETILDAAEAAGVGLDAGCRQGHCGTCEVRVIEGAVRYLSEPQHSPEEGTCLTCIAAPDGDIVLDA